MRIHRHLVAASFVIGAALVSPSAQSPPPAWSQWRGAGRDGLAAFAPPAAWPERLTKRWEITAGLGHSSPVVADGRVFLHARQGEREAVSAFDVASGKPIWQDAYAAPYQVNSAARAHGPGPKSTPVVADGRLFTLGISGILSAYDANSGKRLWRIDSPSAPEFGTAMSPVVDGPHLIAHVGGIDKGALTAFETATGKVVWRWPGDGPGYASPIVADIAGTRQVITQTQKFLVGVGARDGRLLWQVPFRTSHDQNSVTPLVLGDTVIYSGLDSGTIAIRVISRGGTWTAEPLWKNDQISMYMSTAAADDTAIFGLGHRNSGQFFALDRATGRTLWVTRGREGNNASIIRAGSLLLLFTTNAELVVARANPKAFDEVRRYTIAESPVWAHPAVVGNQIFVKDLEKLALWTF